MTKSLEWVKETTDYAMGLSFGAMFFAVFGLLMDDLVLGVALGVLFFIVFSTNEEYEASFDGETLRMADEQSETELDAGSIDTVEFSEGGAMVVRTSSGETHALESGGDDEGMRAFVEKLQAAL